MQLLHIDSSPLGASSASRDLTRQAVEAWKASHPGTIVDYLDVAADTPTHLAGDSLGFRAGPSAEGLTDAQRRENEVSERLVTQFLAADVVVIGAPMYNFTVPTQLKAWIDRIAQPGRTFRYTAEGPEGLAKGKTVIIVSTRGGAYGAVNAMDHQESYLKTVFGFLGVSDIRFVRAEGLGMGDAAKAAALASAAQDVRAHTARAANESNSVIAA